MRTLVGVQPVGFRHGLKIMGEFLRIVWSGITGRKLCGSSGCNEWATIKVMDGFEFCSEKHAEYFVYWYGKV